MSAFLFSAVLLAGGQSRRMGQDKASLLLDGQPLWEHQLATLRALEPAELFVSGQPGRFGTAEVVSDLNPGQGPLGGLRTSLRRARKPWLVVLAIDLPLLPAEYLRRLLVQAQERKLGVVPRRPRGFEPLAAVYARGTLPVAEAALAQGRLSLQGFVDSLLAAGLACAREVQPAEEPYFTNPNTPDEWHALTAARSVSRSARPLSSDQ